MVTRGVRIARATPGDVALPLVEALWEARRVKKWLTSDRINRQLKRMIRYRINYQAPKLESGARSGPKLGLASSNEFLPRGREGSAKFCATIRESFQ